jgi:type I restriction enzyme S subunit
VWVNLGSVVEVSTGPFGTMLHKSDYVTHGLPIVNPQNITADGIIPSKYISKETARRLDSYILYTDDVIIGRRGEMGRCIKIEETQNGWLCGTGCFILKSDNKLSSEFLVTLIRSDYARAYLLNNSIGATMDNLNHGILKLLPIPIPPLAEQYRIVAAIESAFAVIDEIERNKNDLQTAVAAAKSKILSLAISGKLVQQDPADEPASVLLERIRAEKESLIKAGKIKRDKSDSVIVRGDDNSYYLRYKKKEFELEDEWLGETPNTWEICSLEQVAYNIASKPFQILQSEIASIGELPVVSQSAEYIEGYSDNIEKKYPCTTPIVIFGDHTRNIKYIDFDFVVGADGVKIICPIVLNERYFYYCIIFASSNITSRGYSRHFQFLEQQPLSIPPLAEQQRIVVAIETAIEQLDSIAATLA